MYRRLLMVVNEETRSRSRDASRVKCSRDVRGPSEDVQAMRLQRAGKMLMVIKLPYLITELPSCITIEISFILIC
jgi:hypothetical protein